MRATRVCLYALLMGLCARAPAQLGEATAEEAKIGRPSSNLKQVDVPPTADPRDFSGVWRNPPQARAAGASPLATNKYGARSRFCIPSTMILSGGEAGTEILQTPTMLRIVTEEHHNNRRIYIGQKHTQPLQRSANGDSVARWEGNVLVIETVGFLGYGVSPTLVRTERLSKSADGRTLNDDVTYSDTSGADVPRSTTARLVWAPGNQVLEYICEDGSGNYMSEAYQ